MWYINKKKQKLNGVIRSTKGVYFRNFLTNIYTLAYLNFQIFVYILYGVELRAWMLSTLSISHSVIRGHRLYFLSWIFLQFIFGIICYFYYTLLSLWRWMNVISKSIIGRSSPPTLFLNHSLINKMLACWCRGLLEI